MSLLMVGGLRVRKTAMSPDGKGELFFPILYAFLPLNPQTGTF